MESARIKIKDLSSGIASNKLDFWLKTAVDSSASDLFLISNSPPFVRVQGRLQRIDCPPIGEEQLRELLSPTVPTRALAALAEARVADYSHHLSDGHRFRLNLHYANGLLAAAIRVLPIRIPSFGELNLPTAIRALARLPRGLIIVGGPAGSGKTTTVAAIINEINSTAPRHILTIEDPIEYRHNNLTGVVEQVEIGVDAPDFAIAMRSALRQAPDVLAVGEMRDPETIRTAVSAAETGHLVLSTLHTTDIASTISRIADSFPNERQNTIRQELSMTLAVVSTQILLPTRQGGRVPATELLFVGYGARQHIRRNALQHLSQEISLTRKMGSCTLEESLFSLVSQGRVERKVALQYANHPDELQAMLRDLPA